LTKSKKTSRNAGTVVPNFSGFCSNHKIGKPNSFAALIQLGN